MAHFTAPFWLAAGLSALQLRLRRLRAAGIAQARETDAPSARAISTRSGPSWRAFRVPGLAIPLICIAVFEFAKHGLPDALGVLGPRDLRLVHAGHRPDLVGLWRADRHRAGRRDGPFAVARLGEARACRLGGSCSAWVSLVGFGFADAIWMVALLLPLAALTDLVPPTLTAMSANTVEEKPAGHGAGRHRLPCHRWPPSSRRWSSRPLFGVFISDEAGLLPAGRAVPVLGRCWWR